VRGELRIGLNEVSIGMPLPLFATELARLRLARRHVVAATLLAELYDPSDAVEVGFLDRLVEPEVLIDEATAEAARLARLPEAAFRQTRARLRGAAAAEIRGTLAADLAEVSLAPKD
jgi:enoyl-CoA hydratase